MSNYKVLFALRVLKNILVSFIDSFLILYFLDVSDSNILPLGIYKLVAVVCIYAVIFGVRNINKGKNRVNLMRIGIILDFIYFLTIILLREKIVKYMYFVGALYGIEEGFYYSVYNMIESDGVSNEERAKFTGTYTAVQSILTIIFPILFGSFIQKEGFIKCLFIVLVIIVLRIVLSFQFKDNNIPTGKKCEYSTFNNLIKNDKRFKNVKIEMFFEGMTISEGPLPYIVTIYIAKVFSDSFSMGIFTSIFSIISTFIGLYFAKGLKEKYYLITMKVTMALTIVSLVYMVINCNAFSIILFKLFYTISTGIVGLINGNSFGNLANHELIQKEYKVEYYLMSETYLVIGRILSNMLFILMAYSDSEFFMIIFVIFLALYAVCSINLQKSVEEITD